MQWVRWMQSGRLYFYKYKDYMIILTFVYMSSLDLQFELQPQLKDYLAKDDSSIKKYFELSNRSMPQDLKYKVYGGITCLFPEEQVFYFWFNIQVFNYCPYI